MERTEKTSICALLVEEKRVVEYRLERTLSHWQIALSNFEIERLGISGVRVTFKISTARGWSRKFKFQFCVLSPFLDLESFVENNGQVFAYLTNDVTMTAIYQMIRRNIGRDMLGYRRELIAIRYYEKIADNSPEIKAIRISTTEEDARAIDLVVRVRFDGHDEQDIPVQVKSGCWPAQKHRRHHVKGLVPSVAIPKAWAFDRLSRQMKALLRVYVIDNKVLHVATELSLSFVRH